MFDVAVVARDRAEVLRRALLAHERLHHPHAGDVLGERRGHEPESLAHRRSRHGRSASGRARVAMIMNGITASVARASRGSSTSRRNGRAAEHERALRERRDAVGDELVDRLDVVRHPADQDACPVPLVEAERESLQVAEELLAQVREDPLADPAGHVRLDVGHAPVRQPGERRRGHDDDELGARRVVDRVVERVLREERRGQRGRCRGEEREDGEEGAEAVRLRQPPERRRAAAASCSTTSRRPLRRRAASDDAAGLVDAH